MNLSGSSSSLTSDASTKTGTVSLRSYGIGGAVLQKRILLMTRQHSQGNSRGREAELEERTEERIPLEPEAVQGCLFSSKQKRGKSRQHSNQATPTDAGQTLLRARAGSPLSTCDGTRGEHPVVHTGSPPSSPGLGLMATSHVPQPPIMATKHPMFPLKTMSPLKALKGSCQLKLKVNLSVDPGTGETSSAEDETQARAEQSREPVRTNPFLWLCRKKHTRRKTVWATWSTFNDTSCIYLFRFNP